MSPRRRVTDQPHPASEPVAWPALSALLLFWALLIAGMLRWLA